MIYQDTLLVKPTKGGKMISFLITISYYVCFIFSAFFMFLLFFICLNKKNQIIKIIRCNNLQPMTIIMKIRTKKRKTNQMIIVCLLLIFIFLILGISICTHIKKNKHPRIYNVGCFLKYFYFLFKTFFKYFPV
jgi:lipopolysaccharide/colanic/teichoic acid biosynthesis glycosyltransferase